MFSDPSGTFLFRTPFFPLSLLGGWNRLRMEEKRLSSPLPDLYYIPRLTRHVRNDRDDFNDLCPSLSIGGSHLLDLCFAMFLFFPFSLGIPSDGGRR